MANLKMQKRLAATLLKCSSKKVRFDQESLGEIKESITKLDIRGLISRGVVLKKSLNEKSNVRTRKNLIQKKKGLRKGHGSRKGTANARLSVRDEWIKRIRKQRAFLKMIKDKELITTSNYHNLLNKAKGGFFRSERHLKVYLKEHGLFVQEK